MTAKAKQKGDALSEKKVARLVGKEKEVVSRLYGQHGPRAKRLQEARQATEQILQVPPGPHAQLAGSFFAIH